MGRSAAFFDLDKTVIAKSSALAFGRPFYRDGLITRRDVVKSAYAQLMFRLGGTDEQTMARTRDYLAALCKGWQVEQVRQIVAETLHELINPYVYAEAAALIVEHQAAGRDVVLVSASGEEMVRPIGELLGVTDVIATRMTVRGRPVQRRGRVLRGRPEQGRGGQRVGRRPRTTTWPTRTPTPTRTAIARCWSASATRAWSTRTGSCASWPRRTRGRCWSSGTRSRWAVVCGSGPPSRWPRPRSASGSGVAIGIAWYGRHRRTRAAATTA